VKPLNLDTLDALAASERKPVQRKRTKVSPKHERALRRYKGADRSVTLGGVIAPPTKNAAKTAFAAQEPRLSTATEVPFAKDRKVVTIPSKFGC
jgi:hypothetical protein